MQLRELVGKVRRIGEVCLQRCKTCRTVWRAGKASSLESRRGTIPLCVVGQGFGSIGLGNTYMFSASSGVEDDFVLTTVRRLAEAKAIRCACSINTNPFIFSHGIDNLGSSMILIAISSPEDSSLQNPQDLSISSPRSDHCCTPPSHFVPE